MSEAWISLGGNLGDVAATFQTALTTLNQTSGISVVQVSRTYSTDPVGGNAGGQFLNAVALLKTSLEPLALLCELQRVENQLGRTRSHRWSPRTLDLDLLFHDQRILDSDVLTLPHPHLWYRRFVLDPFVEIGPDVVHPRHHLTIRELRERLLQFPLCCCLRGIVTGHSSELQQAMIALFPTIQWCRDPADAWLVFYFNPGKSETAPAHHIDLSSYPTPPEQSIRDVLLSACGTAQAGANIQWESD